MADVAFHAWGKTYDALLCAACEAMLGTMIENPAAVESAARKKISAAGINEEKLLHFLLNEFLFQKNNKKTLLRLLEGGVIQKRGSMLYYEGMAAGEVISKERHNMIADAKPAAMRMFRLYRKEESWHCSVVLDI
ncbi:MAG: archease [Chitinispirillia bacterium]|nr:archease [Chitinispirillia bacterium]